MRWAITLVAVVIWFSFFVIGYQQYSGAQSLYLLFSMVFLVLLIQGLYSSLTYGITFLALVLWIGFWLKFVVHLIDRSSIWAEPIGAFDSSPYAWDEVLLVSSIGAVGVITAISIWGFCFKPSILNKNGLTKGMNGWFTPSIRAVLWGGALLILVATVAMNEMFDIIRLGHRSVVNLPWPWLGVFSWWCNIGFVLVLSALLWLEHKNHNSLYLGVFSLLLAGVLISATLHSRGIYVFIALPVAMALWRVHSKVYQMSSRRYFLILMSMLLGMGLSVGIAQFQRYSGTETVPLSRTNAAPLSKTEAVVENFPSLIRRLSIDRWLGLEGVMAISAYPGKNLGLFIQAASERRTKDKTDLYTGKISQSGFTDVDTTRYHYATMPGAIGFLYLSSSYGIVFLGMFLLTSLLLSSEVLLYQLTDNPFLCALSGMYVTLLIVQLGAGGVVQPLTSYFTTMLAAIMIGYFLSPKVLMGKLSRKI